MSRRKKIVWGCLVAFALLLVMEGSARLISRIRYGNPVAFSYGFSFLGHLADGSIALDQGWGAGRGGDRAATDRDVAAGAAVEELFERRDAPDVDVAKRAPRVVTFNGGMTATINSLGYRGPDYPRDVPAGVHRIGVFGGSYVFGAYLRDDQTWAHLLEKNLQAAGARAEVVNAGNSGANVHDVLSDVIHLTNRVNLNTAVVTTGYNNHPLLGIERRYTLARRADFVLYNTSLLYVMIKERLAKAISQPLDYGVYNQMVRVDGASIDALIALYEKRLGQIATVCQERNIRLVVASEAELFFRSELNRQSSQTPEILAAMRARLDRDGQLTIAELEYYLQGRLNTAIRQFAEGRHLLFFDGEAALLTADKRRNFVDQAHPNEIGAALLAKGLADVLRPSLPTATSPAQ